MTEDQLVRKYRSAGTTCAVIVMAIGVLVLIGWSLDIVWLTSILPGLVAMNPASAVGFILCGIAILCGRDDHGSVARRVSITCATIVLLIGVSKCGDMLQITNIGVDRILFANVLRDPARGNPMAPNTAVAFIASGLAMLLMRAEGRRGVRPGQVFALLAAVPALLAVLGYMYATRTLYGVSSFFPMALHSGLGFILTSLGVLFSVPDRGIMRVVTANTTGGFVARRLLPSSIVIPALFAWFRMEMVNLGYLQDDVANGLLVIANVVFFASIIWIVAALLHRTDLSRQLSEFDLRQGEERYRSVLQQSAEGIYLVDAASKQIIEANPAMERMLGYEPGETNSRYVYDFVSDSPESVDARVKAVLESEGPMYGERQYRRKDGKLIDVIVSASVITYAGRKVLCTVAHDITNRKRNEREIQQTRQFLDSIVENIPNMVFVKDATNLRFIRLNRAGEALLGMERKDVLGKGDYELFPKDEADFFAAKDRDVLSTGRMQSIVNEIVHTKDGVRHLHTKKIPMLDEAGQPRYLLGISEDITDRIEAEEKLREKARQLEEAAQSERAAHEELKAAQGSLVQSEKLVALGQLVAGVAHEINNPLSFVANNVAVLQRDIRGLQKLLEMYSQADDLLAQHQPDLKNEITGFAEQMDLAYTLENVQELMNRSRDGLKRIQRIVKDLRDFARLDESDLHVVDLIPGIESTLNILRGKANGQRVQVQADLSLLPMVECFPAKINQVVMNLVANAIDACPEGGTVSVRTKPVDKHAVQIVVSDTGTGIDPAIRQRIFDPFFTTKPQGQGTGLGLSISYGIIQDHFGKIDLESELGKGTTFTVTLPVARTGKEEKPATA